MANPRLTSEQTKKAHELLEDIRERLKELSDGNPDLLFAYRRRLYVRLSYDERGSPGDRRKLKDKKWKQRRGICAICNELSPETETELDRLSAVAGYTAENTRLVHQHCRRKQQSEKGFT